MTGLPGCFYLGPIVEEDVNSPPEIVVSSPDLDEPLVLDLSEKTAFVLVRDANDPLDLEFRWTITDFGVQGSAVPIPGENEQGSQLLIPRDERFDGKTLTARVTDGFGAVATREWDIEIPEVQ